MPPTRKGSWSTRSASGWRACRTCWPPWTPGVARRPRRRHSPRRVPAGPGRWPGWPVRAMAELLEVRNVSVRFGGIRALDDVSLTVAAGESVGLVGPNGAGKTTLFDCISGRIRPNHGSVSFDGRPLDGVPAYRRARLGLARTFQRLEVFPELTVRDHLMVADRGHRGAGALWRDLLNLAAVRPDEA